LYLFVVKKSAGNLDFLEDMVAGFASGDTSDDVWINGLARSGGEGVGVVTSPEVGGAPSAMTAASVFDDLMAGGNAVVGTSCLSSFLSGSSAILKYKRLSTTYNFWRRRRSRSRFLALTSG